MALEFLFSPLLGLEPALAIAIFSMLMLIFINIFYKVLINQREAKAIKDRQKELSKKMQEERKAGNIDKMNALMKESLSENSKLMRMTLKPMIVSFIVVIIFLPWLNITYGDHLAQVNGTTGVASLGGLNHTFDLDGDNISVENGTEYRTLSSDRWKCDSPNCFIIGSRYYEVNKEGSSLKFSQVIATLPFALPVLGYNLGWLAWYIIFSIPAVIVIRKFMKIYV